MRASGTAKPNLDPENKDGVVLFAEDLMHGMRVDVYDAREVKKRWYSLCRQELSYVNLANNPNSPVPAFGDKPSTEGDVVASLTKVETETNYDLYSMNLRLFQWDGWSLVVPRCADPLMKTSCVKDNQVAQIPVEIDSALPAGTLPLLRFGAEYRFRARVADLCCAL